MGWFLQQHQIDENRIVIRHEFCRMLLFHLCGVRYEAAMDSSMQGISYWKLMRVLFPIARGPVKVPLNHYLTSKLVKQTH